MDNKGLTFEKREGYSNYCTTITLDGDCGDITATINSLLQYLHSADESLIDNTDRFRVCELIKAMLPSVEQMKLLEEAQIAILKKKA